MVSKKLRNNFFENKLILIYLTQIIIKIASQIFAFILSVEIVRICGVEVNGIYATNLALINLTFGVFAASIVTNYIKLGEEDNYYITLVSILVLSVIFLPIIILTSKMLKYNYLIIIVIMIQCIIISVFNVFIALKRLQSLDSKILVPSIIPYIIGILLVFVIRPNNFFSLLFILTGAWSCTLFFVTKDVLFFKIDLSIKMIKDFILKSFIIMGSMIFTQVFSNADILFIKYFMGDTNAGLYKIGTTFSSLTMPIIGIFSYVYLSEVQKIIKTGNKSVFKNQFKKQLILNIVIGLSFFLFSFVFNPILIPLIYGVRASESIPTSIVASISVMLNSISMVYSYTFLGLNKEKYLIPIAAFAAIVNVISNFMLIPIFGILGGAISSGITFLSISLCCSFYIFRWRIFTEIPIG